MAAILDFQLANRADLLSIPLRVIMPNMVLLSPFAQFFSYLLSYMEQSLLSQLGEMVSLFLFKFLDGFQWYDLFLFVIITVS